MSTSLLLRASLSLLLLGGTLTTMAQPTVSATPSSQRSVSQPQNTAAEPIKDPFMLKVRKTGGMCRPNQCFSELTILKNGTYRYGDSLKTATGKLNRKAFAQLKRRVARVNLEQIKSKPFTGLCPTAFDASETSYLFLVGMQVEQISACEYAIDDRDPLFQQANQLYEKIVEQVYAESPANPSPHSDRENN